jgi:hypothetical protein
MHDASGRGLQEGWGARTLVVPAVLHVGILGISGCVVDLRPRSSLRRFAGKLAAVIALGITTSVSTGSIG